MALSEATVILPRHVGGRDDGQAEKRRNEARYQEYLAFKRQVEQFMAANPDMVEQVQKWMASTDDRLRLIEEGLQAINSRVDAMGEAVRTELDSRALVSNPPKRETLTLKK